MMCFFFSSRRRHTRFKCDWSSDVCSSDLFDTLKGNGYYARRPDEYRHGMVVLGILVGFLMLPAGLALMFVAATAPPAPLPWVVAAVLSGIIIAVFGRVMTGRTLAGARAFAKVLC